MAGANEVAAEEVRIDRGPETSEHEVVEVDEEGEVTIKAHQSTSPTVMNLQAPNSSRLVISCLTLQLQQFPSRTIVLNTNRRNQSLLATLVAIFASID